MRQFLVFALFSSCICLQLFETAAITSHYIMGAQGQSCSQACFEKGWNCNSHIVTNNSVDLFKQLGVECTPNKKAWWSEDQPSFVSDQSDPNHGECLGYTDVPGGVMCSGSYPTTSRLCLCDEPWKQGTFGTGLSSGSITPEEKWIFEHFLAEGDTGVMTHFWIAYNATTDPDTIVRYYVDGETSASIEFTPSLACGVGFYDAQAPWGTRWFGHGAKDGAWFWNFKVPFSKSIVVTAQNKRGPLNFYMIVRGGTNLPIQVGNIAVPPTARLVQQTIDATFQPLAWVPIVNLPRGTKGVHFMHTLAVQSLNLNFLEGCYHFYTGEQEFPGTLLSTGTEDYFDSGWYFDAGEFHLPVSGNTHMHNSSGTITWSAYRFHEMDPLQFSDGFQLIWRIGDMVDPAGRKCYMESGGRVVGSPSASNVNAYSWVYTW